MIKAVIFDMDGVLVDAKEWHYQAFNQALEHHGYTLTEEEHRTRYDGLPTRVKLQWLERDKGVPASLHDSIKDLKQKFTLELLHKNCRPNPHHLRTLSELKRMGMQLGVASNSVAETVTLVLKMTELDTYLNFVLSNQDVRLPKPDPEIYRRSIQLLGIKPEECLIVEDNEYGIQAARAAGGHVLVVQGTFEVTLENVQSFIKQIEASDGTL